MTGLAGKHLGQYEIREEIGRGGMATVYRATQTSIGRTVAVKVLPTQFLQDRTFLERFIGEVRALAGLQHPRILPMYDFGEEDGLPYIVMAYLEGGTLADRIKQGPMALGEIVRVVGQIAEALDYAHGEGIIHRDFKPSNVLMDDEGNAYLADFGIAKVTEATAQLTGSGIVGTPAYLAPEMFEPGGVTGAVDVYALGVTLYQMLVGQLPFEADTPLQYINLHTSKPVPDVHALRPDLPGGIQAVIERALAKSPHERYQSAGALAKALLLAVHEDDAYATELLPPTGPVEPAYANHPNPGGSGERPRRLSPALILMGGGLLAVMCIGVVILGVLLATGTLGGRATTPGSAAGPAAEADAGGTAAALQSTSDALDAQATESAGVQGTSTAQAEATAAAQAEATATAQAYRLQALVVSDDFLPGTSRFSSAEAIVGVLEELDYPATYISTLESGIPSSDYLAEFDVVFWSVGNDCCDSPFAESTRVIMDYLDRDGQLVIDGTNISFAWANSPFLQSYLRADDAGWGNQIDLALGPDQHPLSEGFSGTLEFVQAPFTPSVIRPRGGDVAVVLVRGPKSAQAGKPSMIAYQDGRRRVVYASFPLGLLQQSDLILLLENTMEWFKPRLPEGEAA